MLEKKLKPTAAWNKTVLRSWVYWSRMQQDCRMFKERKKKNNPTSQANLGVTQSILWQPTIHHNTTGQFSPTYLCEAGHGVSALSVAS